MAENLRTMQGATMSADGVCANNPAMTVKRGHHASVWLRLDLLRRTSLLICGWTLVYGLYRGYYALGGTIGMFGTPVSWNQWRFINAVGAVILLIAGVLPITAVPLWGRRYARFALLVLCWFAAAGCVMHAFVDATQRVLNLTGIRQIDLPLSFWALQDQRQSDLQDLLWNEPWFLIEGLLWGVLGWIGCGRTRVRRWYLVTALAAIVVLTLVGLLSATGVIGKFIVG